MAATAKAPGNVVEVGQHTIYINPDGKTDFNLADWFPNGIRLTAIKFHHSSANDRLVLREGSADGPTFHVKAASSSHRETFGSPRRYKIYMKAKDCHFEEPKNAFIMLEFA